MLEYIRIACAVPEVQVGNVRRNTEDICGKMAQAEAAGADLVVFPELAVTGYSCADLFFQDLLLKNAASALGEIAAETEKYPALTAVVGVPLVISGQLFNCAAVLAKGNVLGIVPKTFIPNHDEFYERRWFCSARDLPVKEISAQAFGCTDGSTVPVGSDLLFTLADGAVLGVEICEDMWTPVPPSSMLAMRGAEVIVNLSASNETVGKREYRRSVVKQQSSSCYCIYAFCSAGASESTQDLVFSGHSLICENGIVLAENDNLIDSDYLLVQDADLEKVRSDRRKNKSFADAAAVYTGSARHVAVSDGQLRSTGETYPVSKLPFVPSVRANRLERCMTIFNLQVAGLVHRLKTIGTAAVVGVSGGLDSTLALLVSVEAMRKLGRPVTDVHGLTMPCFGTSDRTYRNAVDLMNCLGIRTKEVNIREAVMTHFRDIGHDPAVLNATYENSQARERTQILMDYAGEVGGIVIGTGDLSELALGWCTYNGDHMSMYGVNASIPKTLIRWMIEAIAESPDFAQAKEILVDILDTPISPELLPPDAEGKISQQTEDLVGPYALHDFFLYYMMRFGFAPSKIFSLACRAFAGDFDRETIKKWLIVFYRRFFSQQFKRSCMPDGVKVGSVCLSPRGDWRMPSDASGKLWLEEAENL